MANECKPDIWLQIIAVQARSQGFAIVMGHKFFAWGTLGPSMKFLKSYIANSQIGFLSKQVSL